MATLAVLLAGLLLGLLYNHLSLSVDSEAGLVRASYNPTEVEVLIDDAHWWLNQGESEIALEVLDELESYCQLHQVEAPVELDELYEEALEDWWLFPNDEERD